MVLTACFLQVGAQDYKVDFEQAFALYQEDTYEVEMEYLLFPSHTTTQSTEREMMSMKRDGNRFRMHQFGTEVIYGDEYMLMINERSEFIAIDKRRTPAEPTKADKKAMSELNKTIADLGKAMGLDTLDFSPEDMYDVEYLGVKNGQKGYAFNYHYGEYEKIVAYMDTQTGLLTKYIMYYRQPIEIVEDEFSKVRIEVNFLKQTNNPNFDKDTFNIRKYIDIKNDDEVTVIAKYSDFNLANHLEVTEYD